MHGTELRAFSSATALIATALLAAASCNGPIAQNQVRAEKRDADKTMSATIHRPDDLRWTEGPSALPRGAQMAVLEGDPNRDGPYVIRLKVPDGYRIQPHTHPKIERVTVLEGTLNIGMGEVFNQTGTRAMPKGTYGYWPEGMTHFAWMKGETILQLHGTGPWTIKYVNPSDDPRPLTAGEGTAPTPTR